MKKYIYRLALVSMLSLIAFNCASSRSGSTEQTNSDFPEWFTDRETSDEYYYGIGMAKKQNPSLCLKVATSRARDDVAAQISTIVESMIEDVMEESGIGKNAQSIEFSSSISKQIVSKTLEGSSVDKTQMAKDGTYFVRVKLNIFFSSA